MCKLKVTLKQHTPLIHFQHDQEGATLRATEVKPKLDRFIIEKLGNGDIEQGKANAQENGWIIKGQEKALDYKMKITSVEEPDTQKIEYQSTRDGKLSPKYPFIFGNVDTKEEQKVFRICKTLNIEFMLFNDKLKAEIANAINSFFAITNFGFRQDKGFGSFFPATATPKDFESALKSHFSSKHIFMKKNISLQGNNEFEKTQFLFKKLDRQYKILKSGFRDTQSKLCEYFSDVTPPLKWEKESIKHKAVKGDERYLRILLGLADNFEYTKQSMKVEIKDKKSEIERFQSPLTFKVFENNVYLLYPSKIDSRIIDQTFGFTLKNTRSGEVISNLEMPSIKKDDNIIQNFYYEFLKEKLKWQTL